MMGGMGLRMKLSRNHFGWVVITAILKNEVYWINLDAEGAFEQILSYATCRTDCNV